MVIDTILSISFLKICMFIWVEEGKRERLFFHSQVHYCNGKNCQAGLGRRQKSRTSSGIQHGSQSPNYWIYFSLLSQAIGRELNLKQASKLWTIFVGENSSLLCHKASTSISFDQAQIPTNITQNKTECIVLTFLRKLPVDPPSQSPLHQNQLLYDFGHHIF